MMIVVIQIMCILLSLICVGQAIKNEATRFDIISFCVFCIIFLLLCVGLQGLK
jgi:hypothetical protein